MTQFSDRRDTQHLFMDRLRLLMTMRRQTCRDVGLRIGVHKDTVRKWQKGLTFPRMVQLPPLAKALECSADYLLGMRDTSSR